MPIKLTVKTLDASNHEFADIDAGTLVRDFKIRIEATVNIPAHCQRLIYRGRLLQDDKALAEYKLDGEVIHLVQGAPPSSAGSPGPVRVARARRHLLDQFIQSSVFEQNGPRAEINNANELLRKAKSLLDTMDIPNQDERSSAQISTPETPRPNPTFVGPTSHTVQVSGSQGGEEPLGLAQTPSAVEEASSETRRSIDRLGNPPLSINGQTIPSSSNTSNGISEEDQPTTSVLSYPNSQASSSRESNMDTQIGFPPLSALADLMEEYQTVNSRLTQHRTRLIELLRQDPVPGRLSETRQYHIFSIKVATVSHYLSHVQHAISDLAICWNDPPPRRIRARVFHSSPPTEIVISYNTYANPHTASAISPTSPTSSTSSVASADSTATLLLRRASSSDDISHSSGIQNGDGVSPNIPTIFETIAEENSGDQSNLRSSPSSATGRLGVSVRGEQSSGGGMQNQFSPRRTVSSVAPRGRSVSADVSSNVSPMSVEALNRQDVPSRFPSSRQIPHGRFVRPILARTLDENRNSFDPFLPCNSHQFARGSPLIVGRPRSFRRRADAGPELPVFSSGQEVRQGSSISLQSISRGLVSRGGGLHEAEEFDRSFLRTLLNIRPGYQYNEGESLSVDFLMCLGCVTSIGDISQMETGNYNSYNRLRVPMRDFFIKNVLKLREDQLSKEEIDTAWLGFVDGIMSDLQVFNTDDVRQDVDFPETLHNFFVSRLNNLVNFILISNDENFSTDFPSILQGIILEFVALCSFCFVNDSISLERLVRRYLIFIEEDFRELIVSVTMSCIRDHLANNEVSEEILSGYVVSSEATESRKKDRSARLDSKSTTCLEKICDSKVDGLSIVPSTSSAPVESNYEGLKYETLVPEEETMLVDSENIHPDSSVMDVNSRCDPAVERESRRSGNPVISPINGQPQGKNISNKKLRNSHSTQPVKRRKIDAESRPVSGPIVNALQESESAMASGPPKTRSEGSFPQVADVSSRNSK